MVRGMALLVSGLMLGACGGGAEPPAASSAASTESVSESAPPSAAARDACALLTTADLARALPDVVFAAPERSGRPGGLGQGSLSSCTWTRDDELGDDASIANYRAALERATTVTLMTWTWPDANAAAGYVRSFVDAGTGEVERLEGLGDEAIALTGAVSGVPWRSGEVSASVVVTGKWLDAPMRREAEITLARQVQQRF